VYSQPMYKHTGLALCIDTTLQ